MGITPEINVTKRNIILLSKLSAKNPENTPNKNIGSMRIAIATPTINGESVISTTNHPNATCSIPNPIQCENVENDKF